MDKLILLSEACFKEVKIEESDGAILVRNVKALGFKSLNGREYTESAMENGAELYEGVQIYRNHITPEERQAGCRFVENLMGQCTNPRHIRESREIRLDIKVLKDFEAGEQLLSIVKQMPEIAGFSHNAQGKMRKENDIEMVEEITDVMSLDLVTSPATTNGIFESTEDKEVPMDWTKLTLEELKTHRNDVYEAVIALGAKTRDGEVNKLQEAVKVALKEADDLKVIEAGRQKETLVAETLKEAKLPDYAVTDTLKAQLSEAKDEAAMKVIIEDRKELIANQTGGVKDMGEGRGKKEESGKIEDVEKDISL